MGNTRCQFCATDDLCIFAKELRTGIIDKEIVVSEPDRMSAVKTLASKLLELPDKFMLTVFAGADSAPDEQEELTAYLSEKFPDAEVYFIDGGQEIYPYIFVAE